MIYKAGSRWKSAVCATEVVLVGAPTAPGELCCGGVPMLPASGQRDTKLTPAAGFDGGTALGKRYGNPSIGLNILCTKGGEGALSFAGELLPMIDARKLPSSD